MEQKEGRDDFFVSTKRSLALRVAYRCSNPECRTPTIGPKKDYEGALSIGVAAHITGAAQGGPRFNAALTVEERCGFSNGIWLCQNCAKLVDSDVGRFTQSLLREWKANAEKTATEELGMTTEGVTALTTLSESLPSYYVERHEDLAEIKTLLFKTERGQAVGVVALKGMGGVGKTTLARALTRDTDVQARFPGGVHWVDLGRDLQEGALLAKLRDLIRARGADPRHIETLQGCVTRLRRTLLGSRALLILDDVWDVRHVYHFNSPDGSWTVLLTTRDESVVRGSRAAKKDLRPINTVSARTLLAQAACRTEPLPPQANGITKRCGYLPLAIAIIGSHLKDSPDEDWASVYRRLEKGEQSLLQSGLMDYQYVGVWSSIDISLEHLPDRHVHCYQRLAVFAPNSLIPLSALARVWNIIDEDAEILASQLVGRSLMNSAGARTYALHDLHYDYLNGRNPDVSSLHAELIKTYKNACTDGWPSVPKDGYILRNLCRHLLGAGHVFEAADTVMSLSWIETMCEADHVTALQDDYRRLAKYVSSIHRSRTSGNSEGGNWLNSDNVDCRTFTHSVDLQKLVHLALSINDALTREARNLRDYPMLVLEQIGSRLLPLATNIEVTSLLNSWAAVRCGWCPAFLMERHLGPNDPFLGRLGANCEMTACAISEDGSIIITGHLDGSVILWDSLHLSILESVLVGGRVDAFLIVNNQAVATYNEENGTTTAIAIHLFAPFDKTTAGPLLFKRPPNCPIEYKYRKPHAVTESNLVHDGCIAYAFSLNGYTTYDKHGAVKVWSMERETITHSFDLEHGYATSCALSPESNYLASCDGLGNVHVWSLNTETLLLEAPAHQGEGRCVAVGRGRVVTVDSEGMPKVWQFSDVAQPGPLPAVHRGFIRCCSISGDGSTVAGGSQDGEIAAWSFKTGERLFSIQRGGGAEEVDVVDLSHAGLRMIEGSVWDNWTSADGVLVNRLRIHDVRKGVEESVFSVGADCNVQFACFLSNDGLRAIAAGEGGNLFHVTVRDPLDVRDLGPNRILRAKHIPNTTSALVQYSSNCLGVFDGEALCLEPFSAQHDSPVMCFGISIEGRRALSIDSSGRAIVWDLERLQMEREMQCGQTNLVACGWYRGTQPCAVEYRERLLRVFCLEDGATICERVLSADPKIVVLDSEASRLVITDGTGRMHLLELVIAFG